MATKDTKDTEKETAKEAVKEVTKKEKTGDIYTIEELAQGAATQFDTRPEVVTAALKTAGKESATVEEAKGIINEFLAKEVE